LIAQAASALVATLVATLIANTASALDSRRCLYDVQMQPGLVLEIAVSCDPQVQDLRPLDRYSHGHVSITDSARDTDGFSARYRVALAELARDAASVDGAVESGDSVLAVASSWLLYPHREQRGAAVLHVRVSTPPGIDFVTAQPLTDGVFTIAQSELASAGFSAFGRLRRHPILVPPTESLLTPANYEVVILDGSMDIAEISLLQWIAHSADIMTRFWHGFPAPGLKIFVLPRNGAEGVVFGRDMSGGGVSTLLVVGEHATREQLDADWVLIHELVHVGSPLVRGAPWLTEGLATYLEPLIRARYGLQSPGAMWTEFITHMPRGAAIMESAGLMRGGRRGWYWGGALLMLLADVEMRRASDGRLGLEDCLRAIRIRIGNYLRTISLQEMTAACDQAVGGTVLAELIERHAQSATPMNLQGLWRDLGVQLVNGALQVDDGAPLAGVRQAIVRGGPLQSIH
jgi:hypothetical protein